jgi:site-specific DNA-methyltransferase (adenine-specific)
MGYENLLSSDSIEWSTDPRVFASLNKEFAFTLDPCCTAQNATCTKFYTKEQDGLKQSWAKETVFMNPPYGNAKQPCQKNCRKKGCAKRGYHQLVYEPGIQDWIKKAIREAWVGQATVVMLIPARTETKWFGLFTDLASEIRFYKGRLRFGGMGSVAPFPSAAVVLTPTGPMTKMPVVRWVRPW